MSYREKREQAQKTKLRKARDRQDKIDIFGQIIPKTHGQKNLLNAMHSHRVIFCNGPAGTGKTYLSVGYALQQLSHKEVDRIVITRPMTPVGKEMGFLPGSMHEKIWPYLVPILDEASHFVGPTELNNLVHNKNGGLFSKIEVCPIQFCRGRTFNNCVVILDEAQNTTKSELLAIITRLGHNSKMIIQGDTTQSDFPDRDVKAFEWMAEKLHGLEGISYVRLSKDDIVRDPLIGRILDKLSE